MRKLGLAILGLLVALASWGFTPFRYISDANYTASNNDYILGTTALSAARTITLPLRSQTCIESTARATCPSRTLEIIDTGGVITTTNTLSIAPPTGDTINGSTTPIVLNAPYSRIVLWALDGSGKWISSTTTGSGGGGGTNPTLRNTWFGTSALSAVTTGVDNSAFGYQALKAATTNNRSTAVGSGALQAVVGTGQDDNTAVGYNALTTSAATHSTTALGTQAGQNLTTGINSAFIGAYAGGCGTTGNYNTYIGAYAGQGQNGSSVCNASPPTGDGNTAIGEAALLQISGAAANNVAIGLNAMQLNSTGSQNVAIGYQALNTNSTSNNNVGIGYAAGQNNTTGTSNTGVGYNSLGGNSGVALTGPSNTAVGASALRQIQGGVQQNTGVGSQTGLALASGSNNTLIGFNIAPTLVSGSGNVLFGTASNCDTDAAGTADQFKVCASSGATPLLKGVLTAASLSLTTNGTFLVPNITSDTALADNTVCVTNTGQFYKGSGAVGICLGTSSMRFKTDIAPLSLGLIEVMSLKPDTFRYIPGYGDDGAGIKYGFMAEDVVSVLPELVGHDFEGKPNTVDWAGLVPVLVKAIQEQQAQIDELKRKVH